MMKKQTLSVLLSGTVLFLFSCGVKNFIAPPFTEVSKILELRTGQSISEVSETLVIPPYDIVHSYETNTKIFIYNYRLKDRKMTV